MATFRNAVALEPTILNYRNSLFAKTAGARLPDWQGTGGGTRSQRNGDNVMNWTSPL